MRLENVECGEHQEESPASGGQAAIEGEKKSPRCTTLLACLDDYSQLALAY